MNNKFLSIFEHRTLAKSDVHVKSYCHKKGQFCSIILIRFILVIFSSSCSFFTRTHKR